MNAIVDTLIKEFKKFPQVEAVALGGSVAAETDDDKSDIDIEVFVTKDIPVEARRRLIEKYSGKYEVGCDYFGPGDEFLAGKDGPVLDVMYPNIGWVEKILDNVWEKHRPANGYTTCVLFTIKNCTVLYDRNGWLAGIKKRLAAPYPMELRDNIIRRNLMLLADKPFASYREQIEKALKRGDVNSVNHRLAAFMASYFDIIFALNGLLHPGEKRLVKYAEEHCQILPEYFAKNINHLLKQPNPATLKILDQMLICLKKCL